MQKKFLKDNKGVTGIDLAVAVTIIIVFAGLIATIMYNLYLTNLEILKSANASAYATIILEKVDEKAFEDITDDFVTNLINNNELSIDDSYNVEFSKTDTNELLKVVNLKITYTVNNKEKNLTLNKLKVKEVGE